MTETIAGRRALTAIAMIGGLLLSLSLSACVYHHHHHAPAKVEPKATAKHGPPEGQQEQHLDPHQPAARRFGPLHRAAALRVAEIDGAVVVRDIPRGLQVHRTKAKKRKGHAPPAKHR
jgi:hypothetical protein